MTKGSCPRCGGSGKLIKDDFRWSTGANTSTCPNCGGTGEAPDNPLISLILTFQDEAQLGLQMDHPIPQVEAMKALGHFAADIEVELDITLPRPTKDLVAEAIKGYVDREGTLLAEDLLRGGELSREHLNDMAKAILRAASMPDDLARVLFDASEAQHQGLDILLGKVASLDKDFYPSKSGLPWAALLKGNAARDMARPILEEREKREGS